MRSLADGNVNMLKLSGSEKLSDLNEGGTRNNRQDDMYPPYMICTRANARRYNNLWARKWERYTRNRSIWHYHRRALDKPAIIKINVWRCAKEAKGRQTVWKPGMGLVARIVAEESAWRRNNSSITGSVLTWITHVVRQDESPFSRVSARTCATYFSRILKGEGHRVKTRFYFISTTRDLMEVAVHFSDGTMSRLLLYLLLLSSPKIPSWRDEKKKKRMKWPEREVNVFQSMCCIHFFR